MSETTRMSTSSSRSGASIFSPTIFACGPVVPWNDVSDMVVDVCCKVSTVHHKGPVLDILTITSEESRNACCTYSLSSVEFNVQKQPRTFNRQFQRRSQDHQCQLSDTVRTMLRYVLKMLPVTYLEVEFVERESFRCATHRDCPRAGCLLLCVSLLVEQSRKGQYSRQ